tara:strand:- start:1523 stop:2080 length:558 start_codon:yes stop_codon:yes gene_type:complete
MKEEWKEIKGYEGLYEVSSLGRVKSLAREVIGYGGSTYMTKERVLKPGGKRYLQVVLSKSGTRSTYRVHTLVIEAFIGPKPTGDDYTVDHINRDKKDNRVENLRWATRFEQAANREDTNKNYIPKTRAESSTLYSRTATLIHKETDTVVEYYKGFCRDHGVKSGDINRVIRGERRSCGGWYLLSD